MKEFVIRRYRSDRVNSASQNPAPTPERQALIRIDDDGRVLFANHHTEAVLGYDTNELEGRLAHQLLASREDDPFAPANRHRVESGESVLVTFRHKDGFFFTACVSLRLGSRDSDQAATASIRLRESASLNPGLLRLAEHNADFGHWELDTGTNEATWTEGTFRLLELKPGSEMTPEQALFYCQTGQARVRALFRRCIRTGSPFSLTLTLLTARQNRRRVTLTGSVLNTSKHGLRLGGTLVDHTPEMQQAEHRRQAERLLTATTLATTDLVAAVDRELNLLHCNPAFVRQMTATFAVTPRPGDNLKRLLPDHPNERRLFERLWQRAFDRDSFVVEMPLSQQDRGLAVYEFHYRRLTDEHGELQGAVHVARDISQRVNHAGDGNYRIRHDPVTGLINRREFTARLQRLLAQKNHRDTCDSLLYLDLDDFQRFNEQAGAGACDRYLRQLAGALGVRIRQRDALARLAGDTFALLIENCPEPRARRIADDILGLIAEFVYEWQGQPLQTTASGGLLVMEHTMPGDPEPTLAQAADLCHTAKTSGRNRIHAAHAITGQLDEGMTGERIEQLKHALDDDLPLHYQALRPVTSATWGDYIEVLCRIPGDAGELLRPDQFLPVAERFDFAKRLDRQVIRQTLDWLDRHRLLEPRLKYCGFNLSLASVLDDGFADFLEEALRHSVYANDCFCLEIREGHAAQYPDDVAVLCDALHRIGCRVALDGAGASVESYSMAANLPVDLIKLDRRLMQSLDEDPVQQVMVEALHRIAEAAGKTTVASFIENDDALRRVRALGVHFGQGFRLSRPRPLAELAPAAVELSTGRIGG